jgi:adenylate cyclase
MATETERKFLVDDPSEAIVGTTGDSIDQGYLAIDGEIQVRVRRRGDDYTLTVKRGGGQSRFEEEIEISDDQFASLWELTQRRRLVKRRHVIDLGDEVEVDVYADQLDGLVIAEVEFDSEADADRFEPPAWFGREVTGEVKYSNVNLAVDGLPPEEER